ncbi:DUF4062 domain-containing protein [Aeromonas sp. FDAARGOS 1416]|uniref:DUF4062 domain-containing protein n=1 Tax=Aeromonas TaxID=642 RepID=UPI001C24E2E3|nr:DUF4062 domain-containing protein [Aeromonas sp. FDAARGOS 1416]QXB01514.1 DUF4062 domain-containing protein [Aeromonas sp. FDAARGOS 1416]
MAEIVFVSSTFIDLEHHRAMVRDAVARLQHGAKAMEYFGALPGSPKEECLRLVRESDIYVGIFGMRYGSIDPETGKSLTHLEYEEATALKLPCLIYLMDEENHPVYPLHVEVGESAVKLSTLKGLLRSRHVINYFSSHQELAAKVAQDLMSLTGARESASSAAVFGQIAKNSTVRYPLTEPRYRYLRGRIEGFFKTIPPDAILREALELALAGERLAAGFVLSRGCGMPLDEAIDGLMEFDKVMQEIVAANKGGAADA